MKKIAALITVTTGVVLVSAPAFAGGVPSPSLPYQLSEPGTLGLIAVAAVATVIAARIARRK